MFARGCSVVVPLWHASGGRWRQAWLCVCGRACGMPCADRVCVWMCVFPVSQDLNDAGTLVERLEKLGVIKKEGEK